MTHSTKITAQGPFNQCTVPKFEKVEAEERKNKKRRSTGEEKFSF